MIVGIQYNYEEIRVSTWKIWVSDFLINNELYEIGFHDHAESINAFRDHGWIVHLIGYDEIVLINRFLNQ